jgi:gamma-glutamylcysteine synthetase
MNFADYLKSQRACQDAIDWTGDKTLSEAWQTCQRPDWMLWLYGRNNPDKMVCVKIAVFAAKQVIQKWIDKYPNDNRPQQSIEAAENWIKNPSKETAAAAAAEAAEAAEEASASASAEEQEEAAAAAAKRHRPALRSSCPCRRQPGP